MTVTTDTAELEQITARVVDGQRLETADALRLLESASLPILGAAADLVRRRMHPDRVVTYIIDRNINHTNVCNAFCTFCAFYRPPGSDAEDSYILPIEVIEEKIRETFDVGGRQILMQGGHHPKLRIDYYEDLFRSLKSSFPDLWLHALSPPEITHIKKTSRLTLEETIRRLIEAGLDSIPGGGAEILVDSVRDRLATNKASSDEWLEVMREAHRQGLRTTATMMFGHVETPADRVEHMRRLRDLQDETGGFTAFIGWTFQPGNTDLGGVEATTAEYLRTMSLARLYFDNIENLQASWVTQGPHIGGASLAYGMNDMGSTMIEENVVSAAGTTYGMDERGIARVIRDAGFEPMRRNMTYDRLGAPLHES